MPKQNAPQMSSQSVLSSLRVARGLTQLQLAVLVGVTPNTIQGWEKHGLPHLKKYRKLASILGCDLSDLDEAEERELFDREELESKFREDDESNQAKTSSKDNQNSSSGASSTSGGARRKR